MIVFRKNPVPEILNKIRQLKATSSSLGKEKMLYTFFYGDEAFQEVIRLTLDETLHFNVKSLPKQIKSHSVPNWGNFIDCLYYLSEKTGATKEDKQELIDCCYDSEWQQLLKIILSKNLKCGVSIKTVNKVHPGYLIEMPYMRCSTVSRIAKIEYPAFVQEKVDALFGNIFYEKGKVSYKSRNGNEFLFPIEDIVLPALSQEILDHFSTKYSGLVFHGEFICKKNENEWEDRKKSNGIVNKALAKNQTISIKEAETIHFVCWDVVPLKEFWSGKSYLSYEQRFDILKSIVQGQDCFKKFYIVKTQEVNSFQEAQVFAKDVIQKGGEGAVLKNRSGIWKNTISVDQIKLKAGALGDVKERECELKVVGFNYGKKGTKYETCIGALLCESEDQFLKTSVGSGLSDPQRFYFNDDSMSNKEETKKRFEEQFSNRIITVRFNEIIQDKKGSVPRLFLSRFIEVREDKTTANTLFEIQEICEVE